MDTTCPVNLAQSQKWLVPEADATFPFSCPVSPSLSLSFHRKPFFFKGRWWRNYRPLREPHTAAKSVVTPRYICTGILAGTGSGSSVDKQEWESCTGYFCPLLQCLLPPPSVHKLPQESCKSGKKHRLLCNCDVFAECKGPVLTKSCFPTDFWKALKKMYFFSGPRNYYMILQHNICMCTVIPCVSICKWKSE